jgi:hypothetical protein
VLTMWTWCSFLVASERISPLEQLNRPVPKLLDEIFFFERLEEARLLTRKAAWKGFSRPGMDC